MRELLVVLQTCIAYQLRFLPENILTVAGEMKVYHAMLVGQLQDPGLEPCKKQMAIILVKKTLILFHLHI